jgi:hypothetical protein
MKPLALALLAAACVLPSCTVARHSAMQVQPAAFDNLKTLAGTWMRTDEKGQESVGLVTTVIAGGSVVHETMFPGSPHEMVNTYHMDNGTLVVTHYCAAGNQPRMQCTEMSPGVYVFTLRDITNKTSAGEEYMGALTVRMNGDRLIHDWTSFQEGRPPAKAHFEYTRKKG